MVSKRKGDRLTNTFVKNIAEPGRYGDGRGGFGLSFLVRETKNGRLSKTWAQRIIIGNRPRMLGLGIYPAVTPANAREKATKNAQLVAEGVDIRIPKRKIPTVDQAFEQVIAIRSPGWRGKHPTYDWSRFQSYCKPIGSKPISEVTASDVLNILIPLWYTKNKTARGVRSTLSAVMKWAITEEYRGNDPAASHITKNLSKPDPPVTSPSLDHQDLGRALAQIRDADAWWAEKYCSLFLAFTGVRSAQAREADWSEVNLDKATWTTPGSRMKGGIEHRVPLSTQAIEILLYARDQGNGSHNIFPSQRGSNFMTAGRLSSLMHKLALPAVPHGFRSSFINWANGEGRTHIPEAVAEMVLAHKPSETIKKHYKTSDFFKDREPVMQEWADYLSSTMGAVISATPDTYEEKLRERRAVTLKRNFKVDSIGEDEYQLIVQNLQESQIQDVPDQDTLRRAVDIAAIGLMYDGLLRPKETADALWSDLKEEQDSSGLLNIRHSKENRQGTDHVTYVSPRTMKALDETRRIRRELRMDAKDDRILQMTENALPKHIQKACHAAGLTGTFGGYSPRNGMAQNLIRSGVATNDLKTAKGWRLMATTHSERENLARNGPVAQWYAQKEEETKKTRPVVQEWYQSIMPGWPIN